MEGVKTRVAIGVGGATLPLSGDLNAAGGPAFTASGRALETAETALIVHASGGALGAATRLADHIAQGWTVAQARAVHHMLLPPAPITRSAAARQIGISRQGVDKALQGAGFAALDEALAMLETAPQDTA